MNTQPTNEYLNRERLTDLAQFAVPGGHDLWPRIEKAARVSASGITTPRPGILSLGLSRAWTAVGIVLIAATFAALGFGLAVLVFSNDPAQVPAAQPEATATPPASASMALPSPAPTPAIAFEDSLMSENVARFQSLPVEIQDALVDESSENGNDSAFRYLRDMPDDPVPLSEILEPEVQEILDNLDEPYRRQLLLEGYPNATLKHLRKQWQAGEISDLDYHYGNFDMLVREVYETLFEDGTLLPPLEETLSPAALKRFETLDPLLQASFRQVWETERAHLAHLSDDTTDKLEQKLLNTPLEVPGIQDLGLPAEKASVLEREPDLWDYVQRMVAADLVLDQEWGSGDVTRLQQLIAAYEAPGGKEALTRGLLPGGKDPWLAMVCQPPSWGLVPPEYAIPRPFRNVHPARFVYAWPAPEDALSDAALANLNLLDETMRNALEYMWYGAGPLPHDARFMSCLVARWDRGIADTPVTSIPDPSVYLSPDMRELYKKFSEYGKEVFERELAVQLLRGEVAFKGGLSATENEHVSTHDSTPEEFLEGLRTWADQRVGDWACHIEELDCSYGTPSSTELGQSPSADPSPTDTPSVPESWVSENGFIQFTTGALEDLFDEPLPGTHEWCVHPSAAPKEPAGSWLVPSKLPEGMEQTVRDQMVPQTMVRAFRSSHDRITMLQAVCATRQLNPLTYRAIQAGDRTAYVVADVTRSTDGSDPVFNPNAARSLIMDIGYGTVEFNVFGSVTVDELVAMAVSLVPEELTDAEKGPYPQAVLDALGTGFGPVYVPGKLPDGYEMFGQMQARQEAMEPRTTRLSYVRTSDNYCVFRLNQAGLRQQFPNVVQRAQRGDETTYTTTDESGQSVTATAKWGTVEIDGVTIYAQEFSAQPRNQYTGVYFQSQGVWFNLTISTSLNCDHSLKMVAEIAASLEPLQP